MKDSEYLSNSAKEDYGNFIITCLLERDFNLTKTQIQRIAINVYNRLRNGDGAYDKIRKIIQPTR